MWGPELSPCSSIHDSHFAPLLMLLAIHLLQILLSIMVSELLAICTMSFVPTVGVHRKYFVLDAQREPDSNMRETFFFFFFFQEVAPVLPPKVHVRSIVNIWVKKS